MEHLPVELVNSIMDHCHVVDILNIACCSKDFHALLKPILWRSVKIPLSSLTTKLGPFVENLKYTTHLHIKEGSYSDIQKEENNSEDSDKDAYRKVVDIGFNLARLIGYCCPMKVVYLNYNVNNTCLEYILDTLHHVKTLKLVINSDRDGKMINQLKDLEELQVYFVPNRLPITDDTFWSSIAGEKLRTLGICFQKELSDRAVIRIGNWTCLEQLCICDKDLAQERPLFDLRPLSLLTNLTELHLYHLTIMDPDLKCLCQCLTRLKTLHLLRSQLTDNALSEIHCLECLTHLDLTQCEGITSHCFLYLISLPLHSFNFSSSICPVSDDTTIFNSDVTALNKMLLLKKIGVLIVRSKSGRDSSAVIANSLCRKEAWKMRSQELSDSLLFSSYTR